MYYESKGQNCFGDGREGEVNMNIHQRWFQVSRGQPVPVSGCAKIYVVIWQPTPSSKWSPVCHTARSLRGDAIDAYDRESFLEGQREGFLKVARIF